MNARPKNLLEWHMNEASARRTAERIIAEEAQRRTVTEHGRGAAEAPQMREVRVRDQSGRTITEWHGRASWLRDFEPEPKRLVAINTR
jgi:hypothetical protein